MISGALSMAVRVTSNATTQMDKGFEPRKSAMLASGLAGDGRPTYFSISV